MYLSGDELQSDISERMEPKARCAGRQESVAGQSHWGTIGKWGAGGEKTEGISHFQEHELLSSLPTSLQQQRPQLELVRGQPHFC